MLSCPVYGLFGEVGSVEFEPQTLYWSYRAILSEMRGGFPRLYFHGDGVNLGAFSREGLLTGRISRRALGGELPDEIAPTGETDGLPAYIAALGSAERAAALIKRSVENEDAPAAANFAPELCALALALEERK